LKICGPFCLLAEERAKAEQEKVQAERLLAEERAKAEDLLAEERAKAESLMAELNRLQTELAEKIKH
jgi:hypothetical protein